MTWQHMALILCGLALCLRVVFWGLGLVITYLNQHIEHHRRMRIRRQARLRR